MTYKEEKGISLKQLIAMFVLASAAPLVRSIPGLAAKTAGVKTVLVPEKNMRDVSEIAAEITKGLEIIPVTYMDEVLKIALVQEGKEAEN